MASGSTQESSDVQIDEQEPLESSSQELKWNLRL